MTQLAGIHPIEVCGGLKFCHHDCNVAMMRMQSEVCFSYVEREQLRRILSAKLHIILNIEERIAQKVKTVVQFVKSKYRKNIVTLHPDSKE